MSTHNLCFEQKCEKYQIFLYEKFHVLVVKFSIFLNRHVFVMHGQCVWISTTFQRPDFSKDILLIWQ